MSDYGLRVNRHTIINYYKELSTIQLTDRAYKVGAVRPFKSIELEATIIGTSVADLYSKLDSIKEYLDTGTEEQLILDSLMTRYWNAELESIDGEKVSTKKWQGTLSFICYDPLAYSTIETSSNFNINANPKTITETVGGTGMVNPIYTLTAGETLTTITIKLKNINTNEELQWVGSLATDDELKIDVEHWEVEKNGVNAMSGLVLSSQFPRLMPGNNSITVTGFSTTGAMNITYRDTYL